MWRPVVLRRAAGRCPPVASLLSHPFQVTALRPLADETPREAGLRAGPLTWESDRVSEQRRAPAWPAPDPA